MTDGKLEQLSRLEAEPIPKVRVLAAEDEAPLRLLNQRFFGSLVGEGKPFDHFVIFPDAQSALEEYERGGNYTALITDHHMPGMKGAELARILKERDPNIVTVLFSSKTKEDLEPELAPYIDLSLKKPATLAEAEAMANEVSVRVRGMSRQ